MTSELHLDLFRSSVAAGRFLLVRIAATCRANEPCRRQRPPIQEQQAALRTWNPVSLPPADLRLINSHSFRFFSVPSIAILLSNALSIRSARCVCLHEPYVSISLDNN